MKEIYKYADSHPKSDKSNSQFSPWGFVFQISLIELNYFYNSNFLKEFWVFLMPGAENFWVSVGTEVSTQLMHSQSWCF